MRKTILTFLLCTFSTTVFSQNTGSISGTITDKQTNEPLAGATITIKGTLNTVTSNNEGYFSFKKIKAGQIKLEISYVGYETIELTADITIGKEITVNAILTLDNKIGNEIVVSASKRPEKITDAPASIQVIGKKELEQFTGSNTFELLSKVQGVGFTRTGIDHSTINARGMNNAFNNKLFQIVDGRNSITTLSGGLVMNNNFSLVKDDVEKIEIVLGPQTALYGPNAHNAILNFITKDPRTSQGTTVTLSAGNHYQFSGRIRQATKVNDKWAYKFSGEYAAGKDFGFYDSVYAGGTIFGPPVTIPEKNIDFNFRRLRGEAHVYYRITPKADIIVSTGGSNNNTINTHTGGHLQVKNMTNSFLQARYVSSRFYATIYNAWGNFGNSIQVGGYTRDFWNMTHKTPPMTPEAAEIIAGSYGNRVKETPQRLNAEAQYNYKFEKAGLFLVTGFSYQKDKPRGYGITLVDSFKRIYVTQVGAVLQLEKSLPAWNLRFISAIRLDNHSNFDNFYSPKLVVVKNIAKGNFRVTWGRAYSMPSILFQYASSGLLFFGNGEGITYIPNDTKLSDSVRRVTIPVKPEEANTWEFGYKGTIVKKLYVDFTYYTGKSKNFFGPSVSIAGRALLVGSNHITHNPAFAGTIDNNGFLRGARFTTVSNFGDVKVYGLDAGLTYTFNKYVDLAVKYSWIGSDIKEGNADNDANKDDTVSVDERSLNSPRHRVAAILSFQNLCKQKLFITLSARYVEQFDFYSGNQISTAAGEGTRGIVWVKNPVNGLPTPSYRNFDWGPLGGFTTIDISAGYKINSMISVGMNITNLFDTEQREYVGSPLIGRLIMFELKVHVPNNIKQ